MLVQVETGQMSAVETGQMSAAETGQMSAAETRQMFKSQKWGVVIFTRKKAPAASFLAATGLVRSWPKFGPKSKASQVQILADKSGLKVHGLA